MSILDTLVVSQAQVMQKITELLISQLRGIWQGTNFYNTESRAQAVYDSVDLVTQAQENARRVTGAFQSHVYDQMGLEFPDTTQEIPDYPRYGVTPEEVWRRPIKAYTWARHEGESDEVARSMALERVESLAEEEVTLARRDESARIFGATKSITGYRRVIHPELSSSGTCGLCLVASDRVYYKRDLMPIHKHCKCEVLPIVGDDDPGSSLNQDDLQKIYDAAGGTDRVNLKAVRVKSFVSGELGPVLTGSGAVIPDGEVRPTRKKVVLSERESEVQVTGDKAKAVSRPKSKAEQISSLRERIASMEKLENYQTSDRNTQMFVEMTVARLNKFRKQLAQLEGPA